MRTRLPPTARTLAAGPCRRTVLIGKDGSVPADLDPEDAKLVTLARSARGRTGAREGAAVRDTDGRTYLAASVALPSLKLSALQAAVAAAVSSGVEGLEAAVIVSEADAVEQDGLAAVRDLSPSAPVLLAGPDGTLRTTV
jgi:hypothetical protein